jgi:hypothetical protein
MVVTVDLPLAEGALERFQALADAEVGEGRVLVRRMQLIGPGPKGFRFLAVVDDLAGAQTIEDRKE